MLSHCDKIRRRLLALVFAIVTPSVMAHHLPPVNFVGCELDKTLFFAYTKDRNQAVEVCEVKAGYRYTFGRFTVVDNPSPKLSHETSQLKLVKEGSKQIVLKAGELGSIHREHHAGFALKQGDQFTWLEAETNGEVNLVTATGGWDGWRTAENRQAILLDVTGWGLVNEIDRMTMPPFIYDDKAITPP